MKINNIYYSVQGEGKYIGRPAVFVRVAGCIEPYCNFCDEKEAWIIGVEMTAHEVIDEVFKKSNNANYIVLTGGEPMCYFEEFLNVLNWLSFRTEGMKIGWETSLKYVPKNIMMRCEDSFVISPKKKGGEWNLGEGWEEALGFDDVCWKFLIGEKNDVNKVLELMYNKKIKRKDVWLMPYGVSREEVLKNSELVIELCKKYNMNFSTRLHILQWDRQKGV